MRPHIASPRICPVLATLILLGCVAPCRAQYMFLDSNGDGFHTAADQLAPTGETAFDVWLITDKNRDGTKPTCVQDTSAAFTINSYEFVLHAGTGTVAWGAYTNEAAPLDDAFFLVEQDSTDLYALAASATILPPGAYHLGRGSVTPLTGTPSISFRSSTRLRGVYSTSFGCQCPARDQDNTMKLGVDWFDMDGLAYGGVNNAPRFGPVYDMFLSAGGRASQTLTAVDPEGSPVTFEKVSGPPFVVVATVRANGSAAEGRILAAPGAQNAGSYSVTVRATDDSVDDRVTFQVIVQGVARAGAEISFVVERYGHVRGQLFDVMGRVRRTLLDRDLPAGQHSIIVDRRDENGRMLNAGIYFYQVQTPTRTYTGKIPVLKRTQTWFVRPQYDSGP